MRDGQAARVVKRYAMELAAAPEKVFPLLCPVREYEWIEPWSCQMVYSQTGVAENNAVFQTAFAAQGGEETWVVCRYEKDRAIEFVRFTPGFKVNRLDIALFAESTGKTRAVWTNTYTGLSEAGSRWIEQLTDAAFEAEKAAIEKMLNHYLTTGAMLPMAELDLQRDPHGQTRQG